MEPEPAEKPSYFADPSVFPPQPHDTPPSPLRLSSPHGPMFPDAAMGAPPPAHFSFSPSLTKPFVVRVALLASISSALLGYDIGITSGALIFVREDFSLSSVQQEVFVGILNLVSLVGALVAGRLSDAVGRRMALFAAALIFMAGSLAMAFAPSYDLLLVGRIITGIGVGFGLALPPLFIAEVAPPASRGGLVSFGEVFINFGILLGFFISFVLSGLPVDSAWRWMLGIGALPAILLGVGTFFLPESPRWLIMQGRVREAEDILGQTSTDEGEAKLRLAEILEAAGVRESGERGGEGEEEGQGRVYERHQPMAGAGGGGVWKELMFPTAAVGRMLVVLLGINFFQQSTGIDATVYYSPVMFREAGIVSKTGLLGATLGVGVTKVTFVLISALLIDRCGRRPLLLTSVTGMGLSLIAQGLGFLLISKPSSFEGTSSPSSVPPSGAIIAVLSNCLFVAFFSIGLGPINWLLTAEIFPLRLRAQAIGLGTAMNRIASGVVAMSFLSLGEATSPSGPFFIFAGMCALSFVFFYCFVPETRGKSLEEIVRLFERNDYAPAQREVALSSMDANRGGHQW